MTEEVKKCVEQAERFLALREHNHNELRAKLKVKGYGDSVISQAFEFLDSAGELSEERYIRSFIRSNNKRHPEGRSILLQRLMQKGAEKTLSQEIIDEFYTAEYYDMLLDQAVEDAIRRDRGRSDYQKLLAKLVKCGFRLQDVANKLKS